MIFIKPQDNSLGNAIAAFGQLPLVFGQAKSAQEQQMIDRLAQQSVIDKNNASAGFDRSRTAGQDARNAGFDNPNIGAAISALINNNPDNPDPNFNQGDAIGQIFKGLTGDTNAAQFGDFANDIRSLFAGNRAAATQDANTPQGAANLSALASNKVIPDRFSQNAGGAVLDKFSGDQQAPSQALQAAQLALAPRFSQNSNNVVLDKLGGGQQAPSEQVQAATARTGNKKENNPLTGAMMNAIFKSDVVDANGEPKTDPFTGKAIREFDNAKIELFSQFSTLPENKGKPENQLISDFVNFQEAQNANAPQAAPVTQQDSGGLLDAIGSFFLGGGESEAVAAPQQQAIQISSAEELAALPPGTLYIAPDGTTRQKR